MTLDALRSLERLHGVIAWLATATIVGAAWLTARGRASARARVGAGAAALGLVAVAAALGLALHDPYRSRLRQKVFLASAALGWLFERKQHFAFGAFMLACAALATLAAALRIERRAAPGSAEAALARDLRLASRVAWITAALFALAASIASAIVARRVSF